jgi:PKD repeat protein
MKTALSHRQIGMGIVILLSFFAFTTQAQRITYSDAWEQQGFTLTENQSDHVTINHSITTFTLEDVSEKGLIKKNINLPGTFLFNDAGAPNLPGSSRMIVLPKGASPKLKIIAQRTDTYDQIDIIAAPEIPLENAPMPASEENPEIYTNNAFYPQQPVVLSPVQEIRGLDVVLVGITPFQYNPVSKQLIVYRDLKIEVTFEGGSDTFGDSRLRSRWWDPILSDNLLNFSILPDVDYGERIADSYHQDGREQGAEYVIITPDNPVYLPWADSLKQFRTEQGILTKIVTLTEIGANTSAAIESFITNAYNNWTIPPAACLLLGDHGTDGNINITSNVRNDHPGGYNPYVTDNPYADVSGNQLPDISFARITANNESQLQVMVTKVLEYERNPPADADFYNHPIFALGWQTERWFQICQETVAGYLNIVKGKEPVRINEIYDGNPNVDPWSTAINTNTILNFFGPNGLGYIPSSPSTLGITWTGGNATMVNNAITDGGFLLQHRDHGNYTCWGEPDYCTNNVNVLNNTNSLWPFLMSINCQTGSFNRPGDCLVEKFHRFSKSGQNAGVVAGIGDSEVSYSFVNDTYTWGVYDNFWTDFMPSYGTNPPSRGFLPCFGNAAGKYFLQQSNWPYNASMKPITYRLFHYFGDAFQTIYYELPQDLTVVHDSVIWENETSFDVSADAGSLICLTLDGEILGTEQGTGSPVTFTTPPVVFGQYLVVTVTKENCRRYRAVVPVTTDQLYAVFTASKTDICEGAEVDFIDQSTGSPTEWAWTFDGGNPASSIERFPVVTYDTPGTYPVSLTVTKDGNTDTETKTDYITVYNKPVPDFVTENPCLNKYCQFTDMTDPNGGTITAWKWKFGDPASGVYDSSDVQNPVHAYSQTDTYTIAFTVTNNDVCTETLIRPLDILDKPGQSVMPSGDTELCQASSENSFTTLGTEFATEYIWEIDPPEAGTFTDSTSATSLTVSNTYTGSAQIRVKGINACGEGSWSDALAVTINGVLPAHGQPTGPDTVDVHLVPTSEFTTTTVSGAVSYVWHLSPEEAGTVSGTSTTGTVTWDSDFRGMAEIVARAFDNVCEGLPSVSKQTWIRSTLGMDEQTGLMLRIYPNPNNGLFTLDLSSKEHTKVAISIYNILGKIVYDERSLIIPQSTAKTLDLRKLPQGIYYLKLENDHGAIIRPVVINR